MQLLILNIILALNLTYFVGESAPWDLTKPLVFLIVFFFSFLAIYLPAYFYSPRYFYKIPVFLRFLVVILKQVIISNIRVAKDVINVTDIKTRPALMRLDLDFEKERDIVALGILITFTPGTLCLIVRENFLPDAEKIDTETKYSMYIHEMYFRKKRSEVNSVEDVLNDAREEINENFVDKLKELSD
ncbi:MAG: hypothetical protein EA412_03740 [Chitinophagaceae bacterium]|nr:MAG: hypothetical protein EA412_03740 [Chitinophagaceae bacterium]